MADRVDAKVLEILSRDTWQHIAIDIIVAEDRLVLLEPEPVEPSCDVHTRLLRGVSTAPVTLQSSQAPHEESARRWREPRRAGRLPAPSAPRTRMAIGEWSKQADRDNAMVEVRCGVENLFRVHARRPKPHDHHGSHHILVDR